MLRWRQFNGESKRHTNKAKQGIKSLLPMGRQLFSHLLESRTPHTWKGQMISLQTSSSSSLSPQVYILSMKSYCTAYLFGQVGLPVLAVSPLASQESMAVWNEEKALDLCQPISENEEHFYIIIIVFSTSALFCIWRSMELHSCKMLLIF